MLLNSRISVKLYVLISSTLASFLAFWILNGTVIGKSSTRSCDETIAYPQHTEYLREINGLLHEASYVNQSSKMRTILYWTGSDGMGFGEGNIFASCPVWKCVATTNRTALNVEDFDAILFHAQDINSSDLPRKRSPSQRYVFHNLETQISRPISDDLVHRNFFNWTMTYRRDSTLMRPYGIVKMTNTGDYIPPHIPAVWKDVSTGIIDDKTRKMVDGKTKLVSWSVSDCVTPSRREAYVEALKQHIPIDVFGDCGSLKCDDEVGDCFEMFEREYYFHLAVENSLCNDYVTGNVFKLLQYDIVPVVYGAADYLTMLPPDSYIDLRDFTNPKLLADYLWEVSQDPKRYLSFFKWKNYFDVGIKPEHFTVCELCKKLHEIGRPSIVVEDVYGWWTKGQCLRKPSFKGISAIDD